MLRSHWRQVAARYINISLHSMFSKIFTCQRKLKSPGNCFSSVTFATPTRFEANFHAYNLLLYYLKRLQTVLYQQVTRDYGIRCRYAKTT